MSLQSYISAMNAAYKRTFIPIVSMQIVTIGLASDTNGELSVCL